ncbi:outer membrane beta-barrel protein [Chryseobacterium koreense]|uniref:Outer membrane protein beta-barrel domain-containing protein n=1 Tax=Chryseobacterium koreense CCUG 49689 TaxID=1304281 RepID=A0A0J7IY59_9FLAO|nr:outer membrane beta-barrel protein [Chryseobacterium koreense]KMQ70734.1 hypothetical protein ACM44_10465 [Chryseobacterium koreense CCUG 49689]MBB5333623.1 hypothetical protein [Chryseobacterium koreense]
MKKILSIIFALSFYIVSNAQKASIDTASDFRNHLFSRNKVSFGIKAGIGYSTIYGKDIGYVFAEDKATCQPGYHFGLIVDNKIGTHFWLKHELIFNHKIAGVQLSDSINGRYSSKLTMNYLELQPFNAAFQSKGFQVYAGPYISALLGAKIQRKDNNGNAFGDSGIFGAPNNDESENKYLQKLDFGINIGLEYQLPIGVSIGAKYTHGLTDIFQYASSYVNGDPQTDNIKIYNRGWMVSIGYFFKNGKN